MLKAGDVIRLYHKEVEGFLTNERMTNEDNEERYFHFSIFLKKILLLFFLFYFCSLFWQGLFTYSDGRKSKEL